MKRATALIWIIGGALVAVVFTFDMSQLMTGATTTSAVWHRDFSNLWAGGVLIDRHDYVTLYDRQAFTAWQTAQFGAFGMRTFSYPPTLFPLAQLFAMPPYRLALVIWLVVTGGLFVIAARPWWPKNAGPIWLAVLTPAALLNMSMAHMGFLFGALWLLIFTQIDRRPIMSGALIGLFAMKPQLAILIPIILIIRRDWNVIAAATISSAAMITLSLILYGAAPWHEFLFSAVGTQAAFIDAGGAGFAKLSTSAATAIFASGGASPLAAAGQAVMSMFGLALVVMAAVQKAPTPQLAMLAATATFLVLPYALAYDLTVVAIGALAIVVDHHASATRRWLAGIGFVAPQIGIIFAYLGLPVMSLMLAALAFTQYRAAIGRDAPASAGAVRSA